MNENLTEKIIKILEDKKGKDISNIDVKDKTIIADNFIVVTGTSTTHIRALADNVEEELKKQGIYPNKIEECIMIGDSLKYDIEGALKIGLKAILYDYNNKLPDNEEYIKINKLEELKNIL